MSDTPRTDAELSKHGLGAAPDLKTRYRDVCYFARQLERELTAARKEIEELRKVFEHYHVNNGQDDSCKQCGFDLRNPIHTRAAIEKERE